LEEWVFFNWSFEFTDVIYIQIEAVVAVNPFQYIDGNDFFEINFKDFVFLSNGHIDNYPTQDVGV